MYKSVHIKDFRCFDDLRLDDLKQINLITGTNNVGKTALLEALFLHSGGYNPDLLFTLNGMRGFGSFQVDLNSEGESPLDSFFYRFDAKKTLRVAGDWDGLSWSVAVAKVLDQSELSGLSLSLRKNIERAQGVTSTRMPALIFKLEHKRERGPIQRYFLVMDAAGKRVEPTPPIAAFPAKLHLARGREDAKSEAIQFSVVQRRGDDEAIVEALRIVEPRLKRMTICMEGGDAMLHGDIGLEGRHLLPLSLMGDGMNRLAAVLILIATTRGGVLYIDEIEIGWHHSLLPKVWSAIVAAARHYNVQLFCTTHSLECLSAAYHSTPNPEQWLSVVRLERQREKVVPFQYDAEALGVALSSALEIR